MQGHSQCGGSRRRFLQSSAAAGAAIAVPGSGRAARAAQDAADEPRVPLVTLGKTGRKVTRLGMGTSWAVSPSFMQAALLSGVRYIDTSERYENGRAEQVIGQVLERTGLRDDVHLVTKTTRYRGVADPVPVFLRDIDRSLERLRTDYVDAYLIHGIAGENLKMLKDPAVKGAFEQLKAKGKIRFCGFSCHDPMLPELLETAAEVGWIDQVMIQYNFRAVDHDKLQRAIDSASKANIGLVAMKTQRGADAVLKAIDNDERLFEIDHTLKRMRDEGIKKEVAAIKAVWADERMRVAVSEMTTFSDLRENVQASREPLSLKEARLLDEHRRKTAHLSCQGCGHHCEPAAGGLPVADVLRYFRYYAAYGKRSEARALYQALPAETRALAQGDLSAAEHACPHGLPVVDLVRQADRVLS